MTVTEQYWSEVCVCVCVCTYLFLYPGGDLNLNTHRLMGTCVTVGTYIEVTMGKQAYESYRTSFFEKVKSGLGVGLV